MKVLVTKVEVRSAGVVVPKNSIITDFNLIERWPVKEVSGSNLDKEYNELALCKVVSNWENPFKFKTIALFAEEYVKFEIHEDEIKTLHLLFGRSDYEE